MSERHDVLRPQSLWSEGEKPVGTKGHAIKKQRISPGNSVLDRQINSVCIYYVIMSYDYITCDRIFLRCKLSIDNPRLINTMYIW